MKGMSKRRYEPEDNFAIIDHFIKNKGDKTTGQYFASKGFESMAKKLDRCKGALPSHVKRLKRRINHQIKGAKSAYKDAATNLQRHFGERMTATWLRENKRIIKQGFNGQSVETKPKKHSSAKVPPKKNKGWTQEQKDYVHKLVMKKGNDWKEICKDSKLMEMRGKLNPESLRSQYNKWKRSDGVDSLKIKNEHVPNIAENKFSRKFEEIIEYCGNLMVNGKENIRSKAIEKFSKNDEEDDIRDMMEKQLPKQEVFDNVRNILKKRFGSIAKAIEEFDKVKDRVEKEDDDLFNFNDDYEDENFMKILKEFCEKDDELRQDHKKKITVALIIIHEKK